MKTINSILVNNRAKLTLAKLVIRFEFSNRAEAKSEKTITWYTELLGAFLSFLKSKGYPCYVSSLTLDTARDYIRYLRNKPKYEGHPYTPKQEKMISPRTIQCHVRALKAFSSWLYDEGYTPENRLKILKIPKAPVTVIEPLTPDEIKKITASLNKKSYTMSRNHTLFLTLLDTGLRASEAAGITLGKLNLDEGYIKVMGKGAKERIVPIGKYVQMTLWGYIDKVRPKPFSPDCNNLFLTRNRGPITVNTVKLLFSRLAKNSGVNRLHAHLCRHTFAINYLLNGGDIFSLKEILGHTTLDMVNHYLHFNSSQIIMQHHKFSPIDKLLMNTERSTQTRDLVLTPLT